MGEGQSLGADTRRMRTSVLDRCVERWTQSWTSQRGRLYYSEASLELLEPLFYMEESWLGAWLEADVLHGGVAKVAGAAVLHGGVAVG